MEKIFKDKIKQFWLTKWNLLVGRTLMEFQLYSLQGEGWWVNWASCPAFFLIALPPYPSMFSFSVTRVVLQFQWENAQILNSDEKISDIYRFDKACAS